MHDAGITISNSDLKRLLACANADAALLYLYLAAGNDPAQAQTALRMSQSRVDLAAASLRQMSRSTLPLPKRPATPSRT